MDEVPPWMASPHGSRLLEIVAARDCYLHSAAGRRLLDLTSGWNVANFGWHNPRVMQRALRAAESLSMSPAWCLHPASLQLARALSAEIERDIAVLTAPTGTQAVEFALRIARRATGRATIVSVAECYHGSTSGSMAAGGIEYLRLEARVDGTDTRCLPLPGSADQQAMLSQIRATILAEPRPAAVLLEPVFLNVGGLVPSEVYLRTVFDTARACGSLVIMDEVSTGLGRVRPSLYAEREDLIPDLLVLGKSLGGGAAPISAVVMNRALASHCRGLAFDSTFASIPYACEAALAVIELMKDRNFLTDAAELAHKQRKALRQRLSDHPLIREVRGQGCLTAVELHAESARAQALLADAIITDLLEHDVFIARSRWTNALLLMPPLTIGERQYDFAVAALVQAIERAGATRM